MFRIEVLREGLDLEWRLLILKSYLRRQNILWFLLLGLLNLWSLVKMRCVQNSSLLLLFESSTSCDVFLIWVAFSDLIQFFSSLFVDETVQIDFVVLAIFDGIHGIILVLLRIWAHLDVSLIKYFPLVLLIFFGNLIPYWRIFHFFLSNIYYVHIVLVQYFFPVFLHRHFCVIVKILFLIMSAINRLSLPGWLFCHFFFVWTFTHASAIFVLSPTFDLARQLPVLSRLTSFEWHEARCQSWFDRFYVLDAIFFTEILQFCLHLLDLVVLRLQFPLLLNKRWYHFPLYLLFILFAHPDLQILDAASFAHVFEPVGIFFDWGAISSIFIGKLQILDFLFDRVGIKSSKFHLWPNKVFNQIVVVCSIFLLFYCEASFSIDFTQLCCFPQQEKWICY